MSIKCWNFTPGKAFDGRRLINYMIRIFISGRKTILGLIRAKLLTPISTNESQVKHQKHLYFLFSFSLRIWIPIFRLKLLSRPHDWLLDDPSRGFVKVNLFSSTELFSCWNKGQRYQIKTKNSKETPRSHCLKQKKIYHNKNNSNKFFASICA